MKWKTQRHGHIVWDWRGDHPIGKNLRLLSIAALAGTQSTQSAMNRTPTGFPSTAPAEREAQLPPLP